MCAALSLSPCVVWLVRCVVLAEVCRRARLDKSSKPRLNLSGSWQQGHSAAYNTPFLIQVVCKGFITRGQEIVMAHGSCNTFAHGFPRAVDRFPSGMDSNLEAFSYNPTHAASAHRLIRRRLYR